MGAWLFRWRSYIPLLLIAVILPALRQYSYPFGSHIYDLYWEGFCLVVSMFGLLIRGFTVGYAPRRTSGRNTKNQVADTLNTTGMYSITRNPLYLGNYFMMLGVLLFVRVWWVPVIYTLAFWLYYERIIIAEEAFLMEKFGAEYEQYLRRTPAFLPNFRLWKPPALTFSLRTVLKREYPGFFGAIAAFTALEFAGDYIVEGTLVWDPFWTALFVFAALTHVTLRTLKRKTRWLHVDGR